MFFCVHRYASRWMYVYRGCCLGVRVRSLPTSPHAGACQVKETSSVFLSLKKEKRASASQLVAAYETAARPDLASLQSPCCCLPSLLPPASLSGPSPGMEIPLSLNGHFI